MMIKTRELQEVSSFVDWEKLRDNYLSALYTEAEPEHGRQLGKRAPRARGNKRKKNWNLNQIEKELEEQATKAIGLADKGKSDKKKSDKKKSDKGQQQGNGQRGGVHSAINAVKGATKGNRDSAIPNSRGPKGGGGTAAASAIAKTQKIINSRAPKERAPTATPETLAPVASTFAPIASLAPVAAPVASLAPVAPPVAEQDSNRAADTDGDEFPIMMTTDELYSLQFKDGSNTRQGDQASFNGKPMPVYGYDQGNCPGDGNSAAAVPCAPDNLPQICGKYDESGDGRLSLCLEACIPSFCCIHGTSIFDWFLFCCIDIECVDSMHP